MNLIDLRSDTVTHPTAEMRRAMAEAEVGDDVFGEDPTVNRLQALAADRMGKAAALFVPSGTMGNLAAVLAHCGRGDEMILGDLSHTFLYEAGGASALGGVHPHTVPTQPDGTLSLEAVEAAIRADDDHHPRSRLICLENTHNRCGGSLLTAEYMHQVGELARRHGLKLHVDGARIFNAAVALGVPARSLVAAADSVTFCLSKALCAPVGSVLCGDEPFIRQARRVRKQLGGGMRQAGILAAAGIVALETMVDRLAEDHERARRLAAGLKRIQGLHVETDPPASNMVYFHWDEDLQVTSDDLEARSASEGVLIHGVGARKVRLVVHYWVSDEDIGRSLVAFEKVFRSFGGESRRSSVSVLPSIDAR